ncbi:MAG: HNH endonuclease [Acholeplasmataceae bacterium]
MKSKRTKATDISKKVRDKVMERDHHRCIICGDNWNLQLAHIFVNRSHGGLGVEQNLAVLCQKHHMQLDNGSKEQQDHLKLTVTSYLKVKYGGIDVDKLKYSKWREIND